MVSTMPKRTDTRQRLLRGAATLFHRQGFHATGMNQILEASGAPKGSLYFHFPNGKEQLAAESVELAGEEITIALRDTLANVTNPVHAVREFVEFFANAMEKSGFRDGCPIATVALDVAAESDRVRDSCAHVYRSWLAALAEYLRDRGIAEAKSTELSSTIISTIEGALLLAKTLRDIEPLKSAEKHLAHTLEMELKNAGSSS